MYRVVQLNFTKKIAVLFLLFDSAFSTFSKFVQ